MTISYLSINYASVFQIQNTPDIIGVTPGSPQRDDLLVSTESIARYFLYGRTLDSSKNFGLDDQVYLNYPGGFITVQDKINSKWSDFGVTGTLTVVQSSFFNQGINMQNVNGTLNRIFNVRRVANADGYYEGVYDNDALTIGDYRTFSFVPGMIMAWSGAFSSLRIDLPLWRLCGPPDVPENALFTTVNTDTGSINIPNLQSRFIMGGRYAQHGSYLAFDQNGQTAGLSAIRTTIDGRPDGAFTTTNVGGSNSVTLNTITQLPQHDHAYAFEIGGSTTTVTETENFLEAAASISVSQRYSHSQGDPATRQTALDSVRRTNLILDRLLIRNSPLIIEKVQTALNGTVTITTPTTHTNTNTYAYSGFINASSSLENRGSNGSHENRPPYYALAYIVYVGFPR